MLWPSQRDWDAEGSGGAEDSETQGRWNMGSIWVLLAQRRWTEQHTEQLKGKRIRVSLKFPVCQVFMYMTHPCIYAPQWGDSLVCQCAECNSTFSSTDVIQCIKDTYYYSSSLFWYLLLVFWDFWRITSPASFVARTQNSQRRRGLVGNGVLSLLYVNAR